MTSSVGVLLVHHRYGFLSWLC